MSAHAKAGRFGWSCAEQSHVDRSSAGCEGAGAGQAVCLDGRTNAVPVVPRSGFHYDLIPLPHPSGASTWPQVEPGKTLLKRALQLIAMHPAITATVPIQPVEPCLHNDAGT